MAEHNILGKIGEEEAVRFLMAKGYVIRHRDWHCGKKDLDIVAEKDQELIIVEVKTRTDERFGSPEDAVTPTKIRRIIASTEAYIETFDVDMPVRFDIITITGNTPPFHIEHIMNAFLFSYLVSMEQFYSLIHLDETVSTNSYLNSLCERESIPDFTVVWADFQTAGRGQRGNSWESEAGQNLTFSYVLHPDFITAQKQFLLSEIAALAVKDALEEFVDAISIKWPNDIYWQHKKICGMLIENNLTGTIIHRSINGIGINVNQNTFLSPAPNPVSLVQIIGQKVEPSLILTHFMNYLRSYYNLLRKGEDAIIHSRYMQSLYRRDGFFWYRDRQGLFKGSIVKVEPSGRLWLKDEVGQERSYLFKEVEYVFSQSE